MIYESSKDYGTGIVTMIGDGGTTEAEAWDYVRSAYGMHPSDGRMEYTPEEGAGSTKNPEVWTFVPA